ncbi:MAG: alpha/beta hydrolase [Edaphobacter sp.]
MASPTPKPSKRRPQPSPPPETIDPMWLVKAIAAAVVLAIVCGYLALCLLFYQGQWQLVLHPVRTTAAPQTIAGAPYQLIHFGPDESAIPQLAGWWIPAAARGRYPDATVLFLPAGDGSLADSISTLAALHSLGINVFAFDYRGYGQSANTRPNQQKMMRDSDSAWQYLTDSRAVPAKEIVPYGTGTGAALAAHLAIAHPAIPALILDSPHTDLLAAASRDPRSSLIPISLLFHENFSLAKPLKSLRTPKLLLSNPKSPDQSAAAFRTASEPKIAAEIAMPTDPLYAESITKFLDRYLSPAPDSRLVPSPAPTR